MKVKQVGVMGSASDLGYIKDVENLAFEVGEYVAKNNYTLMYGAEKDFDSLSTAAGRGAKTFGGMVVGVTYGKTPDIYEDMQKYTDVIIPTGMERGGGREFVLVSSCDAIITIGGGSGSLNEISVAYQKKIPIVVMEGTGGWADKLAESYLDERYLKDPERPVCKGAGTPKEAVEYIKSFEGKSF